MPRLLLKRDDETISTELEGPRLTRSTEHGRAVSRQQEREHRQHDPVGHTIRARRRRGVPTWRWRPRPETVDSPDLRWSEMGGLRAACDPDRAGPGRPRRRSEIDRSPLGVTAV